MPDPASVPPRPPRRRRVPSAQRFAAGALASVVAVFGVLALRVHHGDDPALGSTKASAASRTTSTDTSSSSSGTPVDPYDAGTATDSGTTSSDSGASSSSASAPTTPTTHAS
jgi:hypothetical protein